MKGCHRGQAAPEYLLCAAALAAALFVPWMDGLSVASLLARRLAEAFHGLYALLAIA